MPDTKKMIATAVALQAFTVGATCWLYGAAAPGAEMATRNTARMAAVFFAWALAMRPRSVEGRSSMFGFVSAHAMHFASVAYYSAIAAKAPLHQFNLRSVISVTAGLSLLGALAFTIEPQKIWQRLLNTAAAFLFGFVFTFSTIFNGLGLRHKPAWGSLVPLPFLLAAFVVYARSRRKTQLARAASAF